MAPLTFDQITETLSSQESVMSVQDCISRANATAFGTFFIGFSGGIALQAQYPRFMPKGAKSFLVLPLVFGVTTSLSVQHYMVSQCMLKWKQLGYRASTEPDTDGCGCAYTSDSSASSIRI